MHYSNYFLCLSYKMTSISTSSLVANFDTSENKRKILENMKIDKLKKEINPKKKNFKIKMGPKFKPQPITTTETVYRQELPETIHSVPQPVSVLKPATVDPICDAVINIMSLPLQGDQRTNLRNRLQNSDFIKAHLQYTIGDVAYMLDGNPHAKFAGIYGYHFFSASKGFLPDEPLN